MGPENSTKESDGTFWNDTAMDISKLLQEEQISSSNSVLEHLCQIDIPISRLYIKPHSII